MLILSLVPHPEFPPLVVTAVEVEIAATNWEDVLLEFRVSGTDELVLPEWTSSERAERLWATTCFELFLREIGSQSYVEFNFSPSTQWAAYSFETYRSGMRDLALSVSPHLELEGTDPNYRFSADVDLSELPNAPLLASISAVIEEKDGVKSYWALAHPPGSPDFHHPDCFTFQVPPAVSA